MVHELIVFLIYAVILLMIAGVLDYAIRTFFPSFANLARMIIGAVIIIILLLMLLRLSPVAGLP